MSDTMKAAEGKIASQYHNRLEIAKLPGGQILPYEYRRLAEALSAAEERERVLRETMEKVCPMVYATRGEQLRLGLITNEQYRDMVRRRHSGIGAVETVCAALATPAPEPSEQKEQPK